MVSFSILGVIALLLVVMGWIGFGGSRDRPPASHPKPHKVQSSQWATVLASSGLALLLTVSLGSISPSLAQVPQTTAPSGTSVETTTTADESLPPDDSVADTETSQVTETSEETTPEQDATEEVVEQAPVILNQVPLFQVSSSDRFTAEERANTVRQRLQTFIDDQGQAGVKPDIEIDQLNGSPTLMLNDKQLLTVTPADASPTKQTPEALAQELVVDLEEQLQLAIEEQSPDYWRERAVTALGIFGITLLLHIGIVIVMRFCRESLSQKLASYDIDAEPPKLLNVAFRFVIGLMLLVLWLCSLSYTAGLFPLTRRLSYGLREQTLKTLTAPMIPIGNGYSVVQIVLLAVLMVALILASGALTDLLKSRFLNLLGIGRGVQEAIATVFKYSFIALSSIVLLQLWGIDLSALAIFASALSVGIGFGLQDIAKNFGSGLVLVFERPIQVGDFVEVGGYSGTIEKLGARSTTIRTLDNLDVFVPNSRFLEEEVTNWSHNRSSTRIKVPVGVAYGSDLKAVEEALLEAATSSKNLLKMPEPTVFFTGFGDSSLDFVLLVWIGRPQQHVRIKSELNFKIDAAFRRHNIEVPFPQRDLHVRSGNLPIEMLDQEQAKLEGNG